MARPIIIEDMKSSLSRRNFGKLAASAAAYSLVPGRVMGANEKVNVACIGCGGQGAGDAKTIAGTGLVNVVALCDVAMGTAPCRRAAPLLNSVTSAATTGPSFRRTRP